MTHSELEKMVMTYFPTDKYGDDVVHLAKLLAENIERQTRNESASAAYDLANKLNRRQA